MSSRIPDSATVRHLIDGYTSAGGALECMFCDETFSRGRIYRLGDDLVEAELAMKEHIRTEHGSSFEALLALGKKGTGLSDTQRSLLDHFYQGMSDREIQPLAGGVSLSTIRNHRFALRERARQAKVFLALMEMLESGRQDPASSFIEIPGRKSASDERFAITRTEFRKIVGKSFPDGPDGMMSNFPRKQKHKVAVLIHVLKRSDPGGDIPRARSTRSWRQCPETTPHSAGIWSTTGSSGGPGTVRSIGWSERRRLLSVRLFVDAWRGLVICSRRFCI